ncbi:hypothetical protein BLOT_004200 [Blomia tropicalis]|nr:hypothetical protein BLOT_004200 [Blomia tropicalis]
MSKVIHLSPPIAKLIDIDDSFEDVYDEINLQNSSESKDTSNKNEHFIDGVDHFVLPSDNQSKSRWSYSSSVGGTVLNDPIFKSDFANDFRLWSRVIEQKKKLSSSSFSLTSSISNILGFSSKTLNGEENSSNLKTNYHVEQLLSSSNGNFCTRNSDKGLRMTSNNVPLTSSVVDRKISYGETQRLVGGSSIGLINTDHDDEDYDSDGYESSSLNPKNGKCGFNWSLYKGIFYSSLSSIFFSLSAVIVKYLKDIHPGQLAVCRFVGIFVLTIPLIVYHDLNPFGPPELRHLLILRGLAGATSLFLRFVAFHYLPIADASVIIFSIPVFVSIFAWIFLKEPCGLFQSFTIVIAMIGLMMTTKLPFLFDGDSTLLFPSSSYYMYSKSSANYTPISLLSVNRSHPNLKPFMQEPLESIRLHHFYGVLAAMSSLIFASAVFIFIRKAKGAHHAVIMFNFGWVAMIETTVLTSVLNGFSLPANPFEWYLIVILAVFSFCGQILLTRSLQLEQAGPVSVVRATTDIALAFLWQIIIFRETPDMWSIFGALLVSSCILLTSLRKWVLSLPDNSHGKITFVR